MTQSSRRSNGKATQKNPVNSRATRRKPNRRRNFRKTTNSNVVFTADPSDVRLRLKTGERHTVRQAFLHGFDNGLGNLQLGDDGSLTLSMVLFLPPSTTGRILGALNKNTSL
nr:MAG: N protein [Wufeng rodent arterivirus 1]